MSNWFSRIGSKIEKFNKEIEEKYGDGAGRREIIPKDEKTLVIQYCMLRNEVETMEQQGEDVPEERYSLLGSYRKAIKDNNINPNMVYQHFKQQQGGLMQPQQGMANIAEDIFREADRTREIIEDMELKKGDIFEKKTESTIMKPGGAIEITKTSKMVITVCQKRVSESEIAGYCSVCGKAVCKTHAFHCEGYGGEFCGDLLCPKDRRGIPDSEGKMIYYCPKHYNIASWYQKPIALR